MLVVEAEGRRHRFPAMPEPPSPTGAAPGTWQMSFSVPAKLPERPGARAWLQLGGAVVVPLPLPMQVPEAPAPPETPALREEPSTAARAAPPEQRREKAGAAPGFEAAAIQAELARARRATPVGAVVKTLQPARMDAQLVDREHAMVEVHAAERTIAVLRAELEERARSEARLRALLATLRETRTGAREEVLGATLAQLRVELDELRRAVQRESTARAQAEAATVALRRQLQEQQERSARAFEALEQLRHELAALRIGGTPAPEAAEAPEPTEAPGATEAREAAEAPKAAEAPEAAVDPGRLEAALSRLREAAPPEDEPLPVEGEAPAEGEAGAQRQAAGWLWRALHDLVRRDRRSAGQVLVAVVRAAGSGGASFEDLVIEDPQSAAALLSGRGLRRRRRRRALIKGGGEPKLRALEELVSHPPPLSKVETDPLAAFVLAATLIESRWTMGHRFTIAWAHPSGESKPHLQIRSQRRPRARPEARRQSPALTIACPAGSLLGVLAGGEVEGVQLRGDAHALELMRKWLERAQSG